MYGVRLGTKPLVALSFGFENLMTSRSDTLQSVLSSCPVQIPEIASFLSNPLGRGEVHKCPQWITIVYEKTNMADVPRSKEVIQKMDEDERRVCLDVYYRRGK